ncbi:MAG TPA: hypothetical protein VNH11_12980 [Pirellulales bacterium]|nr:hypothetical protein [Pirellulales bacterium]
MSSEFREGQLRFQFSDEWYVVKYDGHRDYSAEMARLQGTKAVDFIALLEAQPAAEMLWMEVKDFRGYRIQNKARQFDGELAAELGEKVRDSIAGLVGAWQRSSTPDVWLPFIERLSQREPPMKVLLWLEDDPPPPGGTRNATLTERVRIRLLKERLRWLTTKVIVASLATRNWPKGMKVSNLPGAGRP